MMWCDTPALMTCWNDTNYMAKAFQSPKIECIVTQHPWIENDCEFADLILPVATKFELDDIGVDNLTAEYGTLFLDEKCIEPVGESKSDYEVLLRHRREAGRARGVHRRQVDRGVDQGGLRHLGGGPPDQLGGVQREGSLRDPQRPRLAEATRSALRGFAEDPDSHPLSTPTGKLEFFSQRLADHFPDDAERPPVPAWVERGPSHDERVGGDRAKLYPYLCLSSHPRWRVHSQHDDMQWLREIQTNKIVGRRRLRLPDGLDTPGGRRGEGRADRRRGQGLQRAGRGAGGRLRDRARDARRGLRRPRRPLRPHRPRRVRPGRGHQLHHPAQDHLARTPPAWSPAPSCWTSRRPTWTSSGGSIRRSGRGRSTKRRGWPGSGCWPSRS